MRTSILYPTLLIFTLAAPLAAQEEAGEKTGWSFRGELSLVATDGNAEATTARLRGKVVRAWDDAGFELETGGLRADNTITRRRAVGVPGDFDLIEISESERTAERYFFRGRYDHDVSARMLWFAGAGWERDEFAGFESRTSVVGGIGHRWLDGDDARLRTDYGLTYTRQDDLIEEPGKSDDFLGARFSYDYFRRLTESTDFTSGLIVDANLDDADDLRADFATGVEVAMSERLALKLSLELLFDNQPALTAIPLETPAGVPVGATVRVPLDNLDSTLNVALVVSW